jgi:exosortase F-associated protein
MGSVQKQPNKFPVTARWIIGIVAASGLVMVFLFQRTNWSSLLPGSYSSIEEFLINRSVRFILNDILAVMLVAALFGKRNLVIIAIYVQLIGFVLILIPYIILKINYPAYNGPLISFLHRLVLNPLLIYLLIFFFWYNERYPKTEGS